MEGCLPWRGALPWQQSLDLADARATGRWGEALVYAFVSSPRSLAGVGKPWCLSLFPSLSLSCSLLLLSAAALCCCCSLLLLKRTVHLGSGGAPPKVPIPSSIAPGFYRRMGQHRRGCAAFYLWLFLFIAVPLHLQVHPISSSARFIFVVVSINSRSRSSRQPGRPLSVSRA